MTMISKMSAKYSAAEAEAMMMIIESINPTRTSNMVKEAPDVAMCREAPADVTVLYKKKGPALTRML